MKKVLLVLALAMTMLMVACGSSSEKKEDKHSLAGKKTTFVSVSTKGSTVTAAQMNGLGEAHPTVSFTDTVMNLYYVMAYPEIEYVYESEGNYRLEIVKEDGGRENFGSIKINGSELSIIFSVQGISQTYVFNIVE